jgi:anti-sigma factor RsiW
MLRSLAKLSDETIHEYIDGRLSKRERAIVAATLIANPHLMRKVMRLLLINEMLRCLGQHVLDEPVPDQLRQTLRVNKSQRRGSGVPPLRCS